MRGLLGASAKKPAIAVSVGPVGKSDEVEGDDDEELEAQKNDAARAMLDAFKEDDVDGLRAALDLYLTS